MEQRLIELSVKGQMIEITSDTTEIVTNTRNYLKCKFTFDSLWDSITNRTAVFQTNFIKPLMVILEDNSCYIPSQVTKFNSVFISVFGDDLLTTRPVELEALLVDDRLTSKPVRLDMYASGATCGCKPDKEDELWYNYLLNKVKDAQTFRILDDNGLPVPKRNNIQYRNLNLSDDVLADKTVVGTEILSNIELENILK